MQSDIIEPCDSLWLETIETLQHDIYHTPAYVDIEAQRNATVPKAFVARERDRCFFAPFLKRSCADIFPDLETTLFDTVSPYGYSGPLLSDAARDDPAFVGRAFAGFRHALGRHQVCAAFFRLHPILSPSLPTLLPSEGLTENGQTISIDLTLDEGKIWSHTRRGHQSTINKCRRLGFTARMVDVADSLDPFVDIYQETLERVQAKRAYFFSRTYFDALLKLGDRLHMCIVEQGDDIAAACLFFECGGIVQAHLGGTRSRFLPPSPFSLLLHHVRLWAKQRGNYALHLGGGVGGSKSDPLHRFKAGFSRQRHRMYTMRLVVEPETYRDLVEKRAADIKRPVDEVLRSTFFPAYRTLENGL